MVGLRRGGQRLFDQAEEELAAAAGFSAIESEGELIEVVIQMLRAHRALMCSQQPSLQQRNNSMHAGQQLAGVPGISAAASNLVIVTFFSQARVAQPPVCMNRAARLDAILHKTMEIFCRGIRDRAHSDSADALSIRLNRDHNQCLSRMAASYSALFPAWGGG